MTRRRIALFAAMLALVGGGMALWAVVLDDDRGSASRLGLPQSGSGDDGAADGKGDGSADGSSAGESGEETRAFGSDLEARDGEQVPDETVYELVDALTAGGMPPVMGGSIVVEYAGRLDTVRVSGRFTGTRETTLTLEYRDGAWRLKE